MAVKEITPQKIEFNSMKAVSFEAATAAADGCSFKIPREFAGGEYLTILAQNSGEAAYDVSVKCPSNGSYAAATENLKLADVAAGGIVAIRVETARFANNDGSIVLIPENVAVKFAVIY